MSRCMITGCALIRHSQYVWGDLHEEGNCWIFNAATWPNGEVIWQEASPLPAHMKCLTIQGEADYFERKGIVVVEKVFTALNNKAMDYLKGVPK